MADPPVENRERATTAAVRIAGAFARLETEPLRPGLHLVATPIGNLGDITIRALSVLARADATYCEDTRRTGVLLGHYGLSGRLRPYHEHNAAAERPKIMQRLASGEAVALVSDAGTPLVSDPGYKLVREAVEAGHRVEALPGPSATLAALTVSGLPTDAFLFAGFLPARSAARISRIEALARIPATLLFFEAPSRVGEALADLAAVLGPRPAAVLREITKLHEERIGGSLPELAERFAKEEPRGEIVIVVGPPGETEVSDEDIARELSGVGVDEGLNRAARRVADRLGVPKARVYALALARKSEAGT